MIIEIPLSSINSTQLYLDVCEDYLSASFIIENISKIVEAENLEKNWELYYYPVYHLRINIGKNKKQLAQLLRKLSILYSNLEGSEFESLWEEIYKYENNLEEKQFVFPEIIDDYYANRVLGAYGVT